MTDAPRTIWIDDVSAAYPNIFFVNNGSEDVYHHDAVVRELVEALEEMVAVHGKAIRTEEMLIRHNRARRLGEAALAKIAQDVPHD